MIRTVSAIAAGVMRLRPRGLRPIRLLSTGAGPAPSAKRRDHERRHYPVRRVRDEGVDHDARPALGVGPRIRS